MKNNKMNVSNMRAKNVLSLFLIFMFHVSGFMFQVSGLTSHVAANPVSDDAARRVAAAFWNSYRPEKVQAVVPEALVSIVLRDMEHLRVYAVESVGFVIVAGDDCVEPVLAYSYDDPFPERLHPALRYWLAGYESQIACAEADGTVASAEVAGAWDVLLTAEAPQTPLRMSDIPAMLTTRWDQGAPYNQMCPYDTVYGQRTAVGCVATAMAQIMRYWRHPSCGTGSHSYMPEPHRSYQYDLQSADFEHTTYLYDYMPNTVDQSSSRERDRNAVATLSYHCGVAVDMQYGPSATGGSGAYSSCGDYTSACAVSAFVDYFKYKSTLHYAKRYYYSDSAWRAKIDENLDAGRPIYYTGRDSTGGHAFVLDGSDLQGRYHFNWGWAGYGNGYYRLTSLNVGGGGIGGNATYSFNKEQSGIFGIEPVDTTLDTVDYYDSVCYDQTHYTFYDHTITAANGVYDLVHLDTIYRVHLYVAQARFAYLNANGGTGGSVTQRYCFLNGYVMPECPFTRQGYSFVGWCASSWGDETIYHVGDTLRSRRNLNLYAIWQDSSQVGIDDVQRTAREVGLGIFPNPATERVTVELPAGMVGRLTVVDALGRRVAEYTGVSTSAEIPVAALPKGAYTVRFETGTGVYNARVIKR